MLKIRALQRVSTVINRSFHGKHNRSTTFSWKQKKQLGLGEVKIKKPYIPPTVGYVDELEKHVDLSEYTVYDFDEHENFDSSAVEPQIQMSNDEEGDKRKDSLKTIQINRLFGSSKPAYMIPPRGRPNKRHDKKMTFGEASRKHKAAQHALRQESASP